MREAKNTKTYRKTMEEVLKAKHRKTTKIERDPMYINYLKCSVNLLFRPFLMRYTKQISAVHTHVYFRWTKQISVNFVASIARVMAKASSGGSGNTTSNSKM